MRTFQNMVWVGTLMTGLALAVLSCSGTSPSSPVIAGEEIKDTASPDTGTLEETEVFDFGGRQDEAAFDVGFEDAIPPGEPGYPCTSSTDCFSGFCITTTDGKKCSVECLDECPFGWSCTLHKPSLPDEIYICAPAFLNLCRPCIKNADCSTNGVDLGDTCIPFGDDGAFCGGNCETKSCPPDYECEETQDVHGGTSAQCVFTGEECSCAEWFIADGASTNCQVQNEIGACSGTRVCQAKGLSPCDAPEPAHESCNGLDDDCDTIIDDGTEWGDCTIDNEFGSCPGAHSCQAGELVCEGPTPAEEECDGEDNDCDEDIDEEFLNTDLDDMADCVDPDDDNDGDPDQTDCLPLDSTVSHYAEETCNGQDDNCSGSVDEGFIDTDFDGSKDCVDDDDDNDGDLDLTDCQPLDPLIHHEAEEKCNGVDDDCNDEIDDGFGSLECGLGECFHQVPECEDGELQSCNPFEGSSAEVCDGKDNNCNDLADDGFPVGQPCLVGLGLCAAAGVEVCTADGQETECSAVPGKPDCDGKECGDDGCGGVCGQCPGANYACMTGICVCQPDCILKNCGDDGCGGTCGDCGQLEACNDGICNGCDDGNNVPWDGCTGGQITEFRVSETAAGNQQSPAVGMFPDGRFVVAWEAPVPGGDSYEVVGRFFGADGQPEGGEFQVNSWSESAQKDVAVSVCGAMSENLVVVWESYAQDGDRTGVYARRYDGVGIELGEEFQVNVDTKWQQWNPDIAALGEGFVIVWESAGPFWDAPVGDGNDSGIFGQIYSGDGEVLVPEFLVNTTTLNEQREPAVVRKDDGELLVFWQSYNQDGSNWGVYGQHFGTAGNTIGAEFQVNEATLGDQKFPRAFALGDGRHAVLWQGHTTGGVSGDVMAKVYFDDGTVDVSEFIVNPVLDHLQQHGAGAALAGGAILGAWASYGQSYLVNSSVLAQRFDGKFEKVGLEFVVHSNANWDRTSPAAAAFPDGTSIIIWESNHQDGSGMGLFAQRFDAQGKKLFH